MPKLRQLEIDNFRCIKRFSWVPKPGINCLVGPGDIGKSTVLDAIDYCLGARRTLNFTDADFHGLDETQPIRIAATVGELPMALLDLDSYGLFLRGFDPAVGAVVDEPGVGHETVITVVLEVDESLEPTWSLYSERATAVDVQRGLAWGQRVRLGPIRLGPVAGYHFAWRQGSLVSRLTDGLPNTSTALASAARHARRAFGDQTEPELRATLDEVSALAGRLGVKIGGGLKAMLDADSVALGRGTVSLHSNGGVPLRSLGAGSSRLLSAGLQQMLDGESSMVIADEIEHGLEPYRVCRLLDELGAKASESTSQVFLTTHSPAVIRELSGEALYVMRDGGAQHRAIHVGTSNSAQGTARAFPEALLARAVIVCEGATEVGLLRGLDQHDHDRSRETLAAAGVVYVDGNGHTRVGGRALALQRLGFATAILRDSDRPDTPEGEDTFRAAGGQVFKWKDGRATEAELFAELPADAVLALLEDAVERIGEPTVNDQLKTASGGALDLPTCRAEVTEEVRTALGKAAQSDKAPWFKRVGDMEVVARKVVGPSLSDSDGGLREEVERLRLWARNATV
ncbi:MAG: AAA family ATPase [Gemmatimonadaceae bacterium]|nr:AAA family ATPase [Gemmatimonadaceae bacterium]